MTCTVIADTAKLLVRRRVEPTLVQYSSDLRPLRIFVTMPVCRKINRIFVYVVASVDVDGNEVHKRKQAVGGRSPASVGILLVEDGIGCN